MGKLTINGPFSMAMLVYQRVTPRISPNLRLVRLVRALPRGFLLRTMLEPLVQDGHVERPAGCVSLEKKRCSWSFLLGFHRIWCDIWLVFGTWIILFHREWKNHPNWRSHIFQRGRAQPPTRYTHDGPGHRYVEMGHFRSMAMLLIVT